MGGGAEPHPRVSPSARADHVRVRSMRSTGTCSRVKCSQRGDGLEKILRVTPIPPTTIYSPPLSGVIGVRQVLGLTPAPINPH